MRILYLVDYPLDSIGGANKSSLTTIKQMVKKGYEVFLFTPQFQNNTILDKEHIFFYSKSYNNKVAFFQKMFYLQKAIRNIRPDIVHAQFSQIGFILMISKKIRIIKKNIKIFFTDRSFFDEYDKKYQWVFKKCAGELDGVICTTNINKERWAQEVPNAKLYLLYNVLEEKWYNYDLDYKMKLKKKYGLEQKKVIGFSGRFVEWKRWDVVYKICEMASENDHYYFAIAISNSDDNLKFDENKDLIEYLDALKKLLGEKLILFCDASEEEMQNFYYLIDFFVLTSRHESFGRVLIEAMTKKNIVIGTNSGGVPEVIGNKEFLVEVGDVKKVIEIIDRYASDNEMYNKCSEDFLRRANNIFGISFFANNQLAIYGEKHNE